ncbi:putative serine incorporator/TMS membrane protein [Rosa chinensis]|uniref:Putative serine incorporator/TMS membrane protein n=1 Tax=Rosa chinensis TaxID=74649 RepID=A0A2P6QRW5_ROSCH|nr:putative serine incorporator/TMS membrane protein [Rosa chinensis]
MCKLAEMKLNLSLLNCRMSISAEVVEPTGEVILWEVVPVSLEQRRSDHLTERKKALRARYVYGIIFLITNLCAWFVRDYGQRVLPELHYLKSCGHGGSDCFHTQGVLRIFFLLMFLTTCKTRKLYKARNAWHSGWWGSKLFAWLVSMMIPLFCPSNYIHLYGELARVGAGIFLVLQLISVIQFIRWWNKYWMPDEQKKQSCSLGLFMSTLFYIASMCGIAVMYSSYAMKSSCALNIFFIIWTAVLLIVMMSVSLHSKVNRGLLSSGIMASYIVFLCWSAIRSEPANEECNPQRQGNANGDWTTILFRHNEVQHEDDIPYKYGFFHLVFSLGAMYFAMLFISWNLNNSAKKWSIDVGWASTWVKIVNEWFAASIYIWTLFSPVLRQSKVMDHEEPVQEIDSSDVP